MVPSTVSGRDLKAPKCSFMLYIMQAIPEFTHVVACNIRQQLVARWVRSAAADPQHGEESHFLLHIEHLETCDSARDPLFAVEMCIL